MGLTPSKSVWCVQSIMRLALWCDGVYMKVLLPILPPYHSVVTYTHILDATSTWLRDTREARAAPTGFLGPNERRITWGRFVRFSTHARSLD